MRKRKKIALLKRTQRVLQAGHDYIEVNGFNVMTYGSSTMGPRCYIGAARAGAGVLDPPGSDAGAGDGVELRCALEELDAVAKSFHLSAKCIAEAEAFEVTSGRYVEQLGFMKMNRGMTLVKQQQFALEVFRKALTNVYNELKELGA